MKVLWLCNGILPKVSEILGLRTLHSGGWLVGLSNDLLKLDDFELCVCFPSKEVFLGKQKNLSYYSFNFPKNVCSYQTETELELEKILLKVNPDVIHIFGTEFTHSCAMMRTCHKLNLQNKTVISIQGLISICKKHYYANLPNSVINGFTLRDIIRKDNIKQQADGFEKRGYFEIEAIKLSKNIIGRTEWDKACISQINSNTKYYFCNETLREEFYKHSWDFKECEEHSIFMSQAYYPLKGCHLMLQAMSLVLKQYPNAKLYIAGNDITKNSSLKQKLLISSYGKYLRKLMKKYQLEKSVVFTGELDEQSMCERFLKSNVFVSASSIENSPNSVGEAMLLGVPTISSFVGGVKSILTNDVDGILYQFDAPYMLAHHICKIFSDKEMALKFSKNAQVHAMQTHNKEINLNRTLEIYKEIEERYNETSIQN